MTPFATTLAPWQVAQLWADLEDAYHGRASHGDTTEVYAYRLLPLDPTFVSASQLLDPDGIYAESLRDNAELARDALVCVIRAFGKRRARTLVIEGMTLDEFARSPGFTHRVHVRVLK